MNFRKAWPLLEPLAKRGLILEHRILTVTVLQLYCDLLSGLVIVPLVEYAEGTGTQLATDRVLATDLDLLHFNS